MASIQQKSSFLSPLGLNPLGLNLTRQPLAKMQAPPSSLLSRLAQRDELLLRPADKQVSSPVKPEQAKPSITELLKKNASLRQLSWHFQQQAAVQQKHHKTDKLEGTVTLPTEAEIQEIAAFLDQMTPTEQKQLLTCLTSPSPGGISSTGSFEKLTFSQIHSPDDVISMDTSKSQSPKQDEAHKKHNGISPAQLKAALLKALGEKR